VDFALPLKSMIEHTESVVPHVKLMKSGIQLLEPVDVYPETIWLEDSVAFVTLELKSTIKRINAVTVLKDIKEPVDKVATEYVHLFVLPIKTGFKEDVSANQDFI
jgi:hypothetical protein